MTESGKSRDSFSKADKKYMKLAIRLAEKAAGNTSPNPMVGAVIVREGKILSSGFHSKAGNPHAEIEAINACADKNLIKGAAIYVTLEPCSIFGRTPPCTDALIKYGIGEVIIGTIDSNPQINGRGIELLKIAGIKTKTGLFEDIIAKQNEVFFKSVLSRMPFVALKIASSIDGKTALKNKKSKWITSELSRKTVQKIRYKHDCILTGINTVIADDPLLYPRCAHYLKNNISTFGDSAGHLRKDLKPDSNNSLMGAAVKTTLIDKKFFRVILDSGLRISRDSIIVKTAHAIKTIIFVSADKNIDKEKAKYLKENSIDILMVKGTDYLAESGEKHSYLDLKEVLEILYSKYEITSVLVESGPELMTEFLKRGLADKFYFFIAPRIIGGDSQFNMFSGLGISAMDDVIQLDFDKIKRTGNDFFITAYPKKPGPA